MVAVKPRILSLTGASLNLQQTLTGSFQSGPGTVTSQGQRATQWLLGQDMFQTFDPNGVARWQQGNMPANGNSPAQWGARANDANGVPFFDTLGLIGVANVLGSVVNFAGTPVTSTSDVTPSGMSVSFTLIRATNIWMVATGSGQLTGAPGAFGYLTVFIDGVNFGHANNGAKVVFSKDNPGLTNGFISLIRSLAAGSHTIDVRAVVDNAALTLQPYQWTLDVIGMGN